MSRNITTIGQKAFLNCENLKEIRFFGDSLCFQKDAFLGCNEVKVLKISKEIKKETAKKEVIENTNSTDKAKKENIVTTELKKDQKTVTITDDQKAEVEKRRKNLISSALNLTEKLEAIETNFWIIADENYTTQIFMAATTFSSNGENFIATIKEVFGEDELKNHNSVSIWFPEDDEKTFFTYLKRLDSSYKFLNGEKGNFEENFRSILGF